MEFWGVEVKAGETLNVRPDYESLIHVSQAALGESKKDKAKESVHLFLNIDGKRMVLGTLNGQNIPQLSFDLVFEKGFELSHDWKNGSVYICGYQAPLPDDGPSESFYEEDDSEDEQMIPLDGAGEAKLKNVKPVTAKANAVKPEAGNPKVKAAVAKKKDNKSEDEDDSDEDVDSGEDDESIDEEMSDDEDSDDDENESESEDEETPKKAEPSKKRPDDSATKTPVPTKKQKTTTPLRTDGKKPAPHTATPHPAKQGGKGAANGNKSQSPKSGGQFSCTSCSKSFGSDGALQSHSKAKHAGK